MTVTPYTPTHRARLETMLVDYFTELAAGIPEETIRTRILELFLDQQSRGIVHIAIAMEEGSPMGFSVYQIDSPQSDWCKRPDWGSIREFYIEAPHRGKGLGTQLAAWMEDHLRNLGAERIYLTADDAIPFWEHCGFSNTHEFCSNELEILTK